MKNGRFATTLPVDCYIFLKPAGDLSIECLISQGSEMDFSYLEVCFQTGHYTDLQIQSGSGQILDCHALILSSAWPDLGKVLKEHKETSQELDEIKVILDPGFEFDKVRNSIYSIYRKLTTLENSDGHLENIFWESNSASLLDHTAVLYKPRRRKIAKPKRFQTKYKDLKSAHKLRPLKVELWDFVREEALRIIHDKYVVKAEPFERDFFHENQTSDPYDQYVTGDEVFPYSNNFPAETLFEEVSELPEHGTTNDQDQDKNGSEDDLGDEPYVPGPKIRKRRLMLSLAELYKKANPLKKINYNKRPKLSKTESTFEAQPSNPPPKVRKPVRKSVKVDQDISNNDDCQINVITEDEPILNEGKTLKTVKAADEDYKPDIKTESNDDALYDRESTTKKSKSGYKAKKSRNRKGRGAHSLNREYCVDIHTCFDSENTVNDVLVTAIPKSKEYSSFLTVMNFMWIVGFLGVNENQELEVRPVLRTNDDPDQQMAEFAEYEYLLKKIYGFGAGDLLGHAKGGFLKKENVPGIKECQLDMRLLRGKSSQEIRQILDKVHEETRYPRYLDKAVKTDVADFDLVLPYTLKFKFDASIDDVKALGTLGYWHRPRGEWDVHSDMKRYYHNRILVPFETKPDNIFGVGQLYMRTAVSVWKAATQGHVSALREAPQWLQPRLKEAVKYVKQVEMYETILKEQTQCEHCGDMILDLNMYWHLTKNHRLLMEIGDVSCDCPNRNMSKVHKDAQIRHFKLKHTNGKYVECDKCNEVFLAIQMDEHKETCVPRPEVMCPECGLLTKDLNKHKAKTHTKLPCDHPGCGQFFKSNALLKNHIQVSHEDKLYYCPQCGKSCQSEYNLDKHIKGVHREKTIVCSICSMAFKRKLNLNKHMMNAHIKARPYKCRYDGCQVDYNDVSNRNSHEKKTHGMVFSKRTEEQKQELRSLSFEM